MRVQDRRGQRLLLVQLVEVGLLALQVLLLDHDRRDRRQLDPLLRGLAHLGPLDALDLREAESDCPGEAAVQALADAERLARASLARRADPDRDALERQLGWSSRGRSS